MVIGGRQKRLWFAAVVALLAAAMGGALIGMLMSRTSQLVTGAIAVAILVGMFLATLPRWRMLDHMQQDSRLHSWYWGGGFGGGLGLILALILSGAREPLFAGAAMVWLLQAAGYSASRLRWWLVHHSEAQ